MYHMRDLSSSRRYSRAAVLLISWNKNDACDMETLSEVSILRTDSALTDFQKVEHLSHLFEESYNLCVHKRGLKLDLDNKTRLQKSIQKSLFDFAYEEDDPGSLLIVYYAGHGRPGIDSGLTDTGYVASMAIGKFLDLHLCIVETLPCQGTSWTKLYGLSAQTSSKASIQPISL